MADSPGAPVSEITLHLRLHDPFVRIFGAARAAVGVPAGTTAAGLLRLLCGRYPGLAEHLPGLDPGSDEALHGNLMLTRGGERLRLQDGLADGDCVRIFPSIAGG